MNFVSYKHGISTFSVTPSGDAGLAINNNFTAIADYLDGVALLAASTFTGTVTAPSFVGPLTGVASGCLPLTGGTMSGNINAGAQQVVNVGKIGVGTASPSYAVDVRVSTSGYISNTCSLSSGVAAIKGVNDTNNVMEFGKFGSTSSAFGVVAAGDGYAYSDNNALSFGAIGSLMKFGLGSSLTEAMRLNSTGLGIGCTPAQKLDVQGSTILRNAANTTATTINGNLFTTTGTAASIPFSFTGKGSGGLIFADIGGGFVATLGTGAIDLQGSSGSVKAGTAAASFSALLGGNGQNVIGSTATGSTVIGGSSNQLTSGTGCAIIAGTSISQNLPSYTIATGQSTAPRISYGLWQSANDTFFPNTPAQTACIPLIGTTTDGTTFVTLKAGGTSLATNDNVITILSNMSVCFIAHVVGRSFTNNNLVAGYRLEGVIDNNGTTTAIVGSVTKTTLADETAGLFNAQAVASGSTLAIQVKGSASNTVRWSARLQMVEVSGLTGGGVS